MGQRQLAVIMFTDLVGYSSLAQRNEALAIALLEKHWALLRPVFTRFDGHEIKTIGDAFLIEFPSALQAVEAGLAMQVALTDYNDTADKDHAIQLRIGIHMGDVERRGDDVFGDGVNIAARLEPLSKPGGVCISEPVYTSISNKVDMPFYPMVNQRLKNISQSIAVYSNRLADDKSIFIKSRKHSLITRITAASLIVILALLVFTWITKESPVIVTTTTETTSQTKVDPVVIDDKSVAVLPFVNRSKSEDDAYFVDGLHDDLLTHLSKIADMKVISRTSVMQYRNTKKTMKSIGKELGVATLLEGSVQRAKNQVRINVQLIDADTDEHLWAEIYDRELTAANIFAIQSEIATDIAKALQATLSPEEQQRLAVVPTENLAAYDAYLLGKQRMAKRTSASLAESIDYFKQAIALDPEFALAYVGLSDSYQLHTLYSDSPQAEMNVLSKNAINMALALNNNLAEAYTSLGLLRQNNKDFSGARVAYLKAMTLNPNYATTYHWYGTLLEQLGKVKEASEQLQKALTLDPMSVIINAGVASYHAQLGRFDEAMAQFEKIIEIDPTSIHGYGGKARLYWSVYGRMDKAAHWIRKIISLDPDNPRQKAFLGRLFLELGDETQAECWLNQAFKMNSESFELNLFMAFIHTYRNEKSQALSYARKAMKKNPSDWGVLKLFRDHELSTGRYDKARSLYEKTYPALLTEDDPMINNTNYDPAIDLAYVLKFTGEQERANLLLDSSLAYIRSGIPRLDFKGYGIADVRIYAIQGKKQQSLKALRQAIDEGWRNGWWYFVVRDPNLDLIRNEPEFKAMLTEIKTDMAEQLVRVNAMETVGDVCVNP